MATGIDITITNITSTSATVTTYYRVGSELTPYPGCAVEIYQGGTSSGVPYDDTGITDENGQYIFQNLTPSTTYTILASPDAMHAEQTFTTLAVSAAKIVQLKNKAGENIYPVTPEDGKATIEVTNTDPGEGVPLQENHFIAVYGDATKVQTDEIADSAITTAKIADSAITTAKIADGAVTSDKIDWATLGRFSSSEQIIGKWIDGRLIYRKVFTGTTTSANSQSIVHGIPNLYAVLNVGGCILSTYGIQPITRVVPDNISSYGIGIGDIDSTKIGNFQHHSDTYKNRPYILYLDYIKTS